MPDWSAQRQAERLAFWQGIRAELADIDPADLSHEESVNYRVYQHQLTSLIDQQRFRLYECPANSDTTFWSALIAQTKRQLADAAQADDYLAQLGTVARYIDQNVDNMRSGIRRGFGPPQVTMADRDVAIRRMAELPDAQSSPFLDPFRTLPESIGAVDRSDLLERGEAVVLAEVQPAFARLLEFYTTEYYPHLPQKIDAASLPDGEAYYQAQLAEYTTTGLTGEQIHQIGLDAVAGLHDEMRAVASDAGFPDEQAMLEFMRTDPQFYETSEIGLLRRAAWHAKRFDGVAHLYFGRLPRMGFGIEQPDPDIAPYYTAGRGGWRRYILNTYNLPARKLYSLPALTLHEAAPGHCFQSAMALEMTEHPDFRRRTYTSAYGEGWGLYTERLGVEMGMYETPFELMGMLSYQMWRAVRLVVDPGIHLLGWTREQAQRYLAENTALNDHEVVTEVDRYISWPGQAASYYLGMLEILRLRRTAEDALGDRFSLRAFHDLVLSLGSVPLTVLADEVGRFIADGGVSPFDDQRQH